MSHVCSPDRIPFESCPLCASSDLVLRVRADCTRHPAYKAGLAPVMNWMACTHCGHVFTDGYFTAAALDLVFASTHPNQEVGFDLERQRHVSAKMVEKVLPYAHAGAWLDVGFGNGALLFTAEEYGFTPVGLDLRRGNVDAMRGIGVEAHCADVTALEQDGRFAVASLADVLEHMPFPGEGLRAVHRLLASDGVVLLSMPNMDSMLWKVLGDGELNPYWAELEHYHNFGRQRLFELLRATGFEPVRFGVSERYRVSMEVVALKRS